MPPPCLESTLLAYATKPAAEEELPASGSTAAAVTAFANPDMPTAEEFYGIPQLEDAQARDEEAGRNCRHLSKPLDTQGTCTKGGPTT